MGYITHIGLGSLSFQSLTEGERYMVKRTFNDAEYQLERELKTKFRCANCKKLNKSTCHYITSAQVKSICIKDFEPQPEYLPLYQKIVDKYK